jgi:hypothetical protein
MHDQAPDEFAVEFSHPVDRVAPNTGKVSHTNIASPCLIDDRHAPHTVLVTGITKAHFVEKAPIDLVDDLQVPWKHILKERDWPLL